MPAAEFHPKIPDVIFHVLALRTVILTTRPAGSDGALPRQNFTPELARTAGPGARNHQEDVVRSLHHWMFAKNMSDNSPGDLGGVGDV